MRVWVSLVGAGRVSDELGVPMNWIEAVGGVWLQSAGWLVGLSLAFLLLTRFSPCNPGKNWWTDRRAALTDLVYWLVLPLLTQAGRVAFLVVAALVLYGNEPPAEFALRRWPLWAQCLAVLVIQDALMYGIHRLFHTRAGWRFHAIHHSPEVLDWTSTQRFHPVNAIAEFALADAVVLMMGFSPLALAILGPINLIYSVMVHANLNWTFGPLRYVFASPVFHRWHHTSEAEGLDKNFAPTFPIFDLAFGTFHMPAGKRPEVYGAEPVPRGFVGQMIHPFRGIETWAYRRPMLASACVVLATGLAYGGWYSLDRAVNKPELAAAEVPADEPPALLRFTPVEERRDASAVAISAAGSRALFGTTDGRVSLLDVAANTEVALEGHVRRVNGVAFSPDGALAISAGGDGIARISDAATGKQLRSLAGHGTSVMCAAIGDDGWAVTGAVDGTVRVWNPEGLLAKKRTFGTGSIHAIALASAGAKVILAQTTGATLWEPTADQSTECAGAKTLVYCVAIGADGSRAVAADYEGRLLIWESGPTRRAVEIEAHVGPVYAVSLTRDGSTIATGGADGTVKIWNAGTGTPIRELDGYAGLMFSVSFDPVGRRVAAAGKDGLFRTWDLGESGIVPAGAVGK